MGQLLEQSVTLVATKIIGADETKLRFVGPSSTYYHIVSDSHPLLLLSWWVKAAKQVLALQLWVYYYYY